MSTAGRDENISEEEEELNRMKMRTDTRNDRDVDDDQRDAMFLNSPSM